MLPSYLLVTNNIKWNIISKLKNLDKLYVMHNNIFYSIYCILWIKNMASRYQNGLAQSLNSSFLWLAVDEILSFLLPFSLLFSLYLSKGAEKKIMKWNTEKLTKIWYYLTGLCKQMQCTHLYSICRQLLLPFHEQFETIITPAFWNTVATPSFIVTNIYTIVHFSKCFNCNWQKDFALKINELINKEL